MDNFEQFTNSESCQERIERLNQRILKRIYRMKSHIQSTSWDQLDNEEKLEQLVDVNDTLFERIVSQSMIRSS